MPSSFDLSSSSGSTSTRSSAHALSYSGSSMNSIFADLSSDVDQDGFLQSAQRAGGPYLCSLPAFKQPIDKSHPVYSHRFASIVGDVGNILTERRIQYTFIQVIGRRSKVKPEPSPVPTVVISVSGHPRSRHWRTVARQVYSHVSRHFVDLSVEIIDEELEGPLRCFPIRPTDSMFRKWDRIRDTILQDFDIFDWTSLECWRYGRSEDPEGADQTVIVSVRDDSDKVYHSDTHRIRGVLAAFQVTDVAILFMKDEILRSASDERLPIEACVTRVNPGVSIGPDDNTLGSSTLGGMVEIRFPDNGPWQVFALTCFHSVCRLPGAHLSSVPGANRAVSRWEWQPEVLRIYQPSTPDIVAAIDTLNDYIAGIRDNQFVDIEKRLPLVAADSDKEVSVPAREMAYYKNQLRPIKQIESERDGYRRFLENREHYLGEVVAGSGVQRSGRQIYAGDDHHDSIVDWALIRIAPHRSVDGNQPFDYDGKMRKRFFSSVEFKMAAEHNPNSIEQLYKCGRSTNFTTGEYSRTVQAQITRERDPHGQVLTKVTKEHAVTMVTTEDPFSRPGDSGSFIFDRCGGVIGLLIGSCVRKNCSYFTPIENVFRDIKEVTGAIDVRIAEY